MNTNDIRRIEKAKKLTQSSGAVRSVAAMAAESIKLKRRSLLQYLVLGGGTFLAGKIIGPSLNLFSGNRSLNGLSDFKNFRVVETDKSLSFFDKSGNKILVIDK